MDEPDVSVPKSRREALELVIRANVDLLTRPNKEARLVPQASKELRAAYAELDSLPVGEEVSTDDQLRARREDRKAHLRAVAAGEG